MRARAAATLAACITLAPATALPCGACRGASGVGSAITAPDETWAALIGNTTRIETGSWSSTARARSEPSGVHALDDSAQLTLAWRPTRRFELALWGGAGAAWIDAPGASATSSSFSDVFARARFELRDESLERPAGFASGVSLTLRAPTGSLTGDTQGGTAASIGALGLGAWEAAAAIDLRGTFAIRWQPFVALEAALRVPDNTLGFARHLGPRATARAGVTWFASDAIALAALIDWTGESPVELRGAAVRDSSEYRTSLAVSLSVRAPNGLRAAFAIAADVPIDALGRNADATVRLSASLGYARAAADRRACPLPTRETRSAPARATTARRDRDRSALARW